MKTKKILLILCLSLGILISQTGCNSVSQSSTQTISVTPTATSQPSPTEVPSVTPVPTATIELAAPIEPTATLVGDPVRGGLLYDSWWIPLGAQIPQEDHPLWASQSTNPVTKSQTWRCVECHGWDYKGAGGDYGPNSIHFTGFPGVAQWSGGNPYEILAALQGAKNPDHDFSAAIGEQGLIDLALFISQVMLDDDQVIGTDKQIMVSYDLAAGKTLFEATCTPCHGTRGTGVNFSDELGPEYLATVARDDPWEFLHKARHGQPTMPDMPSTLTGGWSLEDQVNLMAYVQTLTLVEPVTEGGQIYDRWWTSLGTSAPAEAQPLWNLENGNLFSPFTWRCVSCHGWDYKGSAGEDFPNTGYPGLSSDSSEATLMAWLDGSTSPDHNFLPYLGQDALDKLIAFMQGGLVDMSVYINADKTTNGDKTNGENLYQSACLRCHGEDGQTVVLDDEFPESYLGDVANDDPWEFLHTVAYGEPGENMPTYLNLDWSWQDIADVLAYAQDLPRMER